MKTKGLSNLPYMLYADDDGQVYDHPYLRMVGTEGPWPVVLENTDLLPMPQFSKLFYIPDCPPVGLDPHTGRFEIVSEVGIKGAVTKCHAVAAFLEPGLVRSHLPAANYSGKRYVLPMWAYTAVGFKEGKYWSTAFRVEYNHKWDPRNYDDKELVPAIKRFRQKHPPSRLLEHLVICATKNHCFAAKNLFLKRWEAPLPVSRYCNAACLGCLSLQPEFSCDPSHERITFTPTIEEVVSLAVEHLNCAPEAIVSFGQGCEGEPLTEYSLVTESIQEIRRRTASGTINLNTNGSWPGRIRRIAECGLDSIRISLNSAQPALYKAYYHPKGYDFEDVVESIAFSKQMGLYTMINYLVFPGITDQEVEIKALKELIHGTGVNFIHFKNLNIDPQLYMEKMPGPKSKGIGMKQIVKILKEEFPSLEIGYFNQPVR
jgi:pyruvate-formate lyase-activating enzyme